MISSAGFAVTFEDVCCWGLQVVMISAQAAVLWCDRLSSMCQMW